MTRRVQGTRVDPLAAGPEARLARLVNHVIYRIATGKWSEGQKLPSVREAERLWGVDRRTVLQGYQQLAEMRLVRCVDRSGYFVATGDSVDRVSRHRYELDRMFKLLSAQIVEKTGLSPFAVFQYLAHLAEIKARDAPECAFVECTATQAAGHASEIEQRLGIPCAALVTTQIASSADRVPPGIRLLIVSTFHSAQLEPLRRTSDAEILAVPIELAPAIAEQNAALREAIVVELLDREAENIEKDLAHVLPWARVTRHATEDPESFLEELTKDPGFGPDAGAAFLSPRVWGMVGAKWRMKRGVQEARFQIVDAAWPRIADAIGFPLGVIAS